MPPPRRLVWFTLLSGCVLSFLIFAAARQREEAAFQERFKAASENRVSAIRRETESALHELAALRAHLETNEPDGPGFAQFSELILTHNPSIHSLEWAPAVTLERRSEFERAKAIRIVEGNPAKPRLASARPVYFPIQFLYPRDHNDEAIGFDIARGLACRTAMQFSVQSGQPALTEKFPLVERSGDGYGVLAVLPVFRGRKNPAGFAVAVLQIPDLIARGLGRLRTEAININLYDESAALAKRTLYAQKGQPATADPLERQAAARGERYEASIETGGRQWRVVCVPGPAYLAARYSIEPWIMLMGGLLLTAMLSIHFRVQTDHANQLREINRELTVARDEALEAARLKAQFLANMSHEIRTPMNGLLGLTELAIASPAAKERSDLLEAAHESGQKLLELLNNLLDLSRADAGKITLEKLPFDLKRETEQAVRLFRERAHSKGIKLRLDYPSDLPPMVAGDPTRLRQVLTNLVNNAVKFTAQGSVTVRLRTETKHEAGIKVRFEVEDTGIGIAEDLRSQLFLPFTQGDASTTRCYGGSGLGLAISKQLVLLMEGEIGVDSAPERGSRFWFTVHFGNARAQLPAPGQTESLASATAAPHPVFAQPPRVLLAEDNAVNELVAKRLLEHMRCTVVTARNGLEAVEKWESSHFDLIIMDCQMPEMDGYDATREIRRKETLRSPSERIPVVALTANAMDGDREFCLQAGMDDYLTKPIQSLQLRQIVTRWLPEATIAEATPGPVRH